MHIFFSGIGGTGIGPLALMAKQAGHEVSGSDKQDSQYIKYLKKHGIKNIYIGQTREALEYTHTHTPINWFVYSSALPKENPNHPELMFVQEKYIKNTKRDVLLNHLIQDRRLKLIGVAGTHGKTTTTAMTIWLFNQLRQPVSYSVGGKIPFGEMSNYDVKSDYFILECDEFDRNFLSFSPHISIISGVAYDHHEIYATVDDYKKAFMDYLNQSGIRYLWQRDARFLGIEADDSYHILPDNAPELEQLTLYGDVNRRNALIVIKAVARLSGVDELTLIGYMNNFPGVSRRMEKIKNNLYTDYAHTPEKIEGAMGIAKEIAKRDNRELVVVYEPLTNRRMHYTQTQHRDIFNGAQKLYWVPSYLAREDPNLAVLTPAQLIRNLNPDMQGRAEAAELNRDLKKAIKGHLKNNAVVLCLSGGGGHSLDEWLRKEF